MTLFILSLVTWLDPTGKIQPIQLCSTEL